MFKNNLLKKDSFNSKFKFSRSFFFYFFGSLSNLFPSPKMVTLRGTASVSSASRNCRRSQAKCCQPGLFPPIPTSALAALPSLSGTLRSGLRAGMKHWNSSWEADASHDDTLASAATDSMKPLSLPSLSFSS